MQTFGIRLRNWFRTELVVVLIATLTPNARLEAQPLILGSHKTYPAISGTILQPDGRPAAGVQVDLAIPHIHLLLDGTKLVGDGWPFDPTVLTDNEGHFYFPPADDVSAVLAVDENGYAEIKLHAFETASEILLQPWGQIEGTLRIGNDPGVGEQINIWSPKSPNIINLAHAVSARTDGHGKFVFKYLPAGTWIISQGNSTTPIWDFGSVVVKAGETNDLTLGRTGRPVIGKLQLPAEVTNSGKEFVGGSNGMLFGGLCIVQVRFNGSSGGIEVSITTDGTFRISEVPAGTWRLEADIVRGIGDISQPLCTFGKTVVVSEIPEGHSDEPLDLGTLEPVMVHQHRVR
jgi:hypothetical protein